jgi:hypothetical protein
LYAPQPGAAPAPGAGCPFAPPAGPPAAARGRRLRRRQSLLAGGQDGLDRLSRPDHQVLGLGVPRAWLRRNRAGLWYSTRDIPPDRIRRVLSFAELAGASAA